MVAAVAASAPAMAQDSSVETVVVTGSRIPQQGLYSSSPVTAVGQQELKFQGTTQVENMLSSLPSVMADNNDYQANGATGTATVNLRGLGANRTLVLVDGKRLLPGDPLTPVADLNNIPAELVDHVEVLTGGASSTYGSDAVAGVVNFIMRKDFEGIELDGQYSIANDSNDHYNSFSAKTAALGFATAPKDVWDGQNVDGTIIMGVNTDNGKGNVTLYAGYRDVQTILESARDFSACTANDVPYSQMSCGGSSNRFAGVFYDPSFTAYASNPAFTGFGGAQPQFILGGKAPPKNTIPGTLCHDYVSLCSFNYAPYNYLQRPDQRYNGGAYGHYEVNKMLDIYTSIMFTDDHTVAQIAPSGLFAGSGPENGLYSINCDNPFLGPHTVGSQDGWDVLCGGQQTGDVNVLMGRRFVPNNRQDDLRHTTYRILVGAKGDLGGGWAYDFSAQYAQSLFSEQYLHDVSARNVEDALHVGGTYANPVCLSGNPGCVPLNIFSYNSASQAAINYASIVGQKEGWTDESVVSLNVTGDLGSWGVQSPWAKSPVGVALGSEYRQEQLVYRPDYEMSTGDLAGQGGPSPAVHGGYNVSEIYGEVRVPIIQDMPFAEDLTANAGYRYSSYNTAGSTTTYKYGLEWQPIDDVKLRGSFARAVRAPNVNELFTPKFVGLYGGLDPCSSSGIAYAAQPLSAAQCARTGVTATQYANGGVPSCPASQCSALFSGNVNLKPEISDTKSFGVVLTPTFLEGFTATIDYFDIKIDDAIGTTGEALTIAACAGEGALGGAQLFSVATSDAYCGLIHRTPGAGTLFGNNGYVVQTTQNLGSLQTKGVDFEANYSSDLSDWGMGNNGSLAFHFIGTYTKNFINRPATGTLDIGSYDCAGLYGATCGNPIPKWRHSLRVTWSSPWDFDLSLNWRYYGSVSADTSKGNQPLLAYINTYTNCATTTGSATCTLGPNKIASYNYFDLAANWEVSKGVELRAGVTNLLDKAPPMVGDLYGFNANTYAGIYDTTGRVVFVGGTVKF